MARAFLLSLLALGSGCGENVLVGNWQLRRLGDAGPDFADDVDADAGVNPLAAAAEHARADARKKDGKQHDGNSDDHN